MAVTRRAVSAQAYEFGSSLLFLASTTALPASHNRRTLACPVSLLPQAVLHNSSVYIFGGIGLNLRISSALRCLDCNTYNWTYPTSTGPAPEPRYGHTAVIYHGCCCIFRLNKNPPHAVLHESFGDLS